MTLRCFQGRIIWNIMTESIWQVNAMLFYRLLCPVALRTIWRSSLGFICFHTTTRSSRLYTIQTLKWSMFALALRAIFIFDRIVKHITSIIHKHVCALNKLHMGVFLPYSAMATFFLGRLCYGHFLPWYTLLWSLSSLADFAMTTFFLGILCYGHFLPWQTLL